MVMERSSSCYTWESLVSKPEAVAVYISPILVDGGTKTWMFTILDGNALHPKYGPCNVIVTELIH